MKKVLWLFSVTCLCLTNPVKAQFSDAPALQHYFDFSAADTNKLLLDIYNQNFLKNSEYFGPITHGMTLFGDDLNAQVGWVPDKHVLLLGGIYVRKDFGNQNFEIVQPTWTVKLQDNKGISFLVGNLESAMDHRYIDPVFQCLYPMTNFRVQAENPLETGLQLKVDKPWLWLDVWIDWAHQEYLNSNYHENILQGLSSNIVIFRANDEFNISVPIQTTFFHFGGQIDTAKTPYVTIFNGAAGLDLNWKPKNSFISEVKVENYDCVFNDVSDNPGRDYHIYPYTAGSGYFFNCLVRSKYGFGIDVSYWNGTNYVAPLGTDLYQSVSWVYGSYTENNRQLAFLRFFYQKELFPNFYVDLRLEPYRDINLGFNEFAYYAFFTYKRTFTLTKVHLPKFNDNEYSH